MKSFISAPTVNQINGFAQTNPILFHYLKWKENTNHLHPGWNLVMADDRGRGIQRKTFRGNCIYGNLLKSVSAFCGINLKDYNYHRDNLSFDLDVRWMVRLDVDGVWINASFPWTDDKDEWRCRVYFRERLRAGVPFNREALTPVIEQYNRRFYFPENTCLGIIQRKYGKSKAQAMEFFKDLTARAKTHSYPVDIDDSAVQRSMARKLKRSRNIIPEVNLTCASFNALMARSPNKTIIRARHFDMSWAWELDGDVDEIEAEFYNQMEEGVVYI